MAWPGQVSHQVRFGEFQLDLQTAELLRNGHKLILQDQPFQVLTILLQRPGQLVTREELKRRLWPSDTFVDFDHGLNKAVNRLREVLGDSADQPRFIETLPRRGYRFIVPVQSSTDPLPLTPGATVVPEKVFLRPARARRIAFGTAIAAILAISLTAALRLRRTEVAPMKTPEIVPLTGMAGIEDDPAFSPDGNQVAFVRADDREGGLGIYTAIIGGEKLLRLTTSSDDCCPVWSPDGRSIAFAHSLSRGYAIYVLPALGGTPKKVYEMPAEYAEHVDMPATFSWSPDAKSLAISTLTSSQKRPSIALLSLEDGSTRVLTSPPPKCSDWFPSFAPDGSLVAFLRSSGPGFVDDLYVVPAAGGEPKRLTFDRQFKEGRVAWTPDSKEIIFSSAHAGLTTLWRASVSGGSLRRVEGVGTSASTPAVALKGDRLVFVNEVARVNLWRVRLADPRHVSGVPQILLDSKGEKGTPYFSADGGRIVFESSQSGYFEIWAMNSDSSSQSQVTFLNGLSGTPRWSYDGRFVAFDYRPAEHSEIYSTDVAGRSAHLVPTIPGADNTVPSWSHDNRWIYFSSNRGDEPTQVWKVLAGGGSPIQLTTKGGMGPIESQDGYVFFTRTMHSDEILKVPNSGGDEISVMKGTGLDCWCNWALAPAGIYFIDGNTGGSKRLWYYEFATKRLSPLLVFQKHVLNPAISPDGKTLIYVQMDQFDRTIMLVNYFR
jgi:Tol biopolymer transport system component/DNA-binding winged helix-turn-helix (wHTH) protein